MLQDPNSQPIETGGLDRGAYVPPDAVLLERMPLSYAPASCTQLNEERLPPVHETDGMSLAFRRRTSEEEQDEAILSLAGWLPTGLFVILLASLTLTRVAPFVWAAGLAGAVSAYAVGYMTLRRMVSVRGVLTALIAPILLVCIAYAASSLIHSRLLVSLVLAVLTVAIFAWRGARPLTFLAEWVCTHRRLRPQTRKDLRSTLELRPTWWVLLASLAIAVFVPWYSTALAMLLILALCGFVCLRRGLDQFKPRRALQCLGLYLAYGFGDLGAPGVWHPKEPLGTRRRTMLLLAGTLFFTLGTGLTLFFPWDVARPTFQKIVILDVPRIEVIRDAFDTPRKPVDWSRSPAALLATSADGADSAQEGLSDEDQFRREYLRSAIDEFWTQQIGDRPYTWFLAALAGVFSDRFLLLWCFPAALILALLFPNIVLLAVYYDALRRILIAREKTESDSGLDADDRTEWALGRDPFALPPSRYTESTSSA